MSISPFANRKVNGKSYTIVSKGDIFARLLTVDCTYSQLHLRYELCK